MTITKTTTNGTIGCSTINLKNILVHSYIADSPGNNSISTSNTTNDVTSTSLRLRQHPRGRNKATPDEWLKRWLCGLVDGGLNPKAPRLHNEPSENFTLSDITRANPRESQRRYFRLPRVATAAPEGPSMMSAPITMSVPYRALKAMQGQKSCRVQIVFRGKGSELGKNDELLPFPCPKYNHVSSDCKGQK